MSGSVQKLSELSSHFLEIQINFVKADLKELEKCSPQQARLSKYMRTL